MFRTARIRRLSKEGFWIVLGQVFTVAGSLVGVRLLTELLTPDAYGELALGMTVATLVNQIIFGPLGGGITRFYAPAVEYGDLSGYLNASKKMMLYATGLVFLIGVIFTVAINIMGQSQWAAIAVSALVLAFLSGYSSTLNGIQAAARQRPLVALYQGSEPLLRAIFAAGLLVWFGATSTVAMVGYVFALVLLLCTQLFFFSKCIQQENTKHFENNNWQEKIWKFSWPMGTWGIFTWLQLSSDRWALQAFASSYDVGNYAVLYQLGFVPISMMSGMAAQFLLPILYQRAGDASDSRRNSSATYLSWKLTWLSLALTFVLFFAAILLHAFAFQVLVSEKFRAVSYLLPWIILAGGIFAAGQLLASNLLVQMKSREMINMKITTAVFGFALNILGAQRYGIQGVIGAAILFALIYFCWMVLIVLREEGKSGSVSNS